MSKKKTNDEFIKQLKEIHNDTIIPLEEYKPGKQRTKVKCLVCGHEWGAFGYHLTSPTNPTGCEKCAKKRVGEQQTFTKEEIIKKVKILGNNEYEVIEWFDYKKTADKVRFLHKTCGHSFKMTVNNFFSGERCPKHRYDKIENLKEKQDHHYYLNRLRTECSDFNEYVLLNTIDNGSETRLRMIHTRCLGYYECDIINFLGGNRCNCGTNMSNGELRIKNLLDDNCIIYQQEKKFKDLINEETKYPLRFDFYLPTKKFIIEFDGRQHFVPNTRWRDPEYQLKETQKRDRIKDEYCKNKNLKLLRIHYKDFNKIAEILKENDII